MEPEEETPDPPTLYQVGPESLDADYVPKGRYQWVVYWYESGCYSGDGDAISWDGAVLRSHNLSHCSCYSARMA